MSAYKRISDDALGYLLLRVRVANLDATIGVFESVRYVAGCLLHDLSGRACLAGRGLVLFVRQ